MKSKLLFECLFNISCDGLNINKAIWSRLNAALKEMGHQGLMFFVAAHYTQCTMPSRNVLKHCRESMLQNWCMTFIIDLKINYAKYEISEIYVNV